MSIVKGLIFYAILFLIFIFCNFFFTKSCYAYNQCSDSPNGVSYCSSSYYPPSGSRASQEWGFACENSTNSSLQAPYCYYNNGNAGQTNPSYCSSYQDNFGAYGSCMSNLYWDNNTSSVVQLWSGSCPSGYQELTPGSVGQSFFTDCANGNGSQHGLAFPKCCLHAGAPVVTCQDVGGYCNNFQRSSSCSQKYYQPNSTYDEFCTQVNYGCCTPQTCANVSGQCINGATQSIPSGYTYDSAGASTIDANCQALHGNNPNEICVQPYRNFPACTSGVSSCGVCNATSLPTNTCGTYAGTQTCTHTNTQPCNPATFSGHACTTTFVNNCSTNYVCSGATGVNACTTSLTISVFKDYNHDAQAASDPDFAGIAITLKTSGGTTIATQTTGSNGTTTFSGLTTGSYTATATIPSNYQASSTNPLPVTLTTSNGNTTVYIGITPLYKISGKIFGDDNKNQQYDGTDSTYTNRGTITVSNGPTNVAPITVAADGTYTTPSTLLSGSYKVSYTSALAAGYAYTTPSSWVVTVGDPAGSPDCSVGSSLDASCGGLNNGSISNLDFGVTNENPWNQSACFDVRNDIDVTDAIPASPSCGGVSGAYATITQGTCSTGAGIVYSCNNTPDFGLGSANSLSWQAGGATSQECFTGPGLDVIRTSYSYLDTTARQSNITPIDMNTSGVCGANGTANCTLDPNLEKGVYSASGDVYLNSFTFPAPADPATDANAYIFMINGNLHILGNIIIPKGSVAVFSASGNIYVDKSVGQDLTNPNDPSVNTPDMEGIYSADQNFIIQSYASGTSVCNANGTPIDKKLNVLGVVITNASKGGGGITNNRDLCQTDLVCPTFTTGDGINAGDQGLLENYLLSLLADGKFVTRKLFNWQEVRP